MLFFRLAAISALSAFKSLANGPLGASSALALWSSYVAQDVVDSGSQRMDVTYLKC